MKRERAVSEKGFTLIEVMIAMFILSFIVGGLATISIQASRSSQYAQRLARAMLLAEGALEKYRNTAFESLGTAWTGETCANAGTLPAVVTTCTYTSEAPFTRTRTVQYMTTGVAATSFTAAVNVGVTWGDARGQTQRVGIGSTISKY
jgi:prepilin-type N-terminal cleavage/methylation domain-containing protein